VKTLLRALAILGVISVAAYLAARVMRRRGAGKPEWGSWAPPTVEPPPAPPQPEPPATSERDEAGAEASRPEAPEQPEPPIPPTAEAEADAGDTEPEPADIAPADQTVPSTESPVDFEEVLEAAEHGRDLYEEAPASLTAESVAGAPEPGPFDELTEAFNRLAATPEPETPEPETPGDDEPLLGAVEEALSDIEPAPIPSAANRSAESHLDEGNVYFNVGQYGLAIERYSQAIEADARLTAAHYNRANARARAGDLDGALQDYDRAIELNPADADALNNRGMLHLYRANYSAAISDFDGALAADPSDPTVMVNRGLARLHMGAAGEALADFRAASTMDDADAAAHYGAAQALATLGNREEALRSISRALEIDPGYAREAAGDPRLAMLQGDDEFLRLLRQSGSGRTQP